MSRRRCLTSIASFEDGRGVGTECSSDRLSDLPEEIAHNIFSLLTFRDLTYFASLSKRCREVYLSTPRLNFSLLGVKTSTCDEWSRLLDSVDRFLNLRGLNKLHHLGIRWSYLEWNGNTFVNHQSGVLEKAEISLWSGADREDGRALDLLCSTRRIKALTLDENAIMALFRKGSVSIPPLDDVSYLCLNIGRFIGKLVLPLVSLLRGMPNLNTLNMNSSPSCFPYRKTDWSGYDMKYWKSQNLPFISQLKEVTIELSRFSCGSNPVEYSTFILEHARNLEKMVIVHTHRFAKASLKKLNESKKSSNAQGGRLWNEFEPNSTRASFISWQRLVWWSLVDDASFFYIKSGVPAGVLGDSGGRQIVVIVVGFSDNMNQLRVCFTTNRGTVKVRLQAETTVQPRRRELTELLALEVFQESMRSAPDSDKRAVAGRWVLDPVNQIY
ncbi:hypothetical protein ACFXTH_010135 [Malus domestica]